MARRQLIHLQVPDSVITDWAGSGLLQPIHRSVYAVGHTALSTEAHLTAAVLYAGPGAMLTAASGVWWLQLTVRGPPDIHVATPKRAKSIPGVVVHARRPLERWWHRGLPLAPLADLLLDYAATHELDDVRYVLSQADYRHRLDLDALEARMTRGRAGARLLRRALKNHQPQLARTRSDGERLLLRICEQHGISIPIFNLPINGFLADAVWREERVIVEVDGRDGHTSWARIRADHARDVGLRLAGWLVLRYTMEQLESEPEVVAKDIARALAERALAERALDAAEPARRAARGPAAA